MTAPKPKTRLYKSAFQGRQRWLVRCPDGRLYVSNTWVGARNLMERSFMPLEKRIDWAGRRTLMSHSFLPEEGPQ